MRWFAHFALSIFVLAPLWACAMAAPRPSVADGEAVVITVRNTLPGDDPLRVSLVPAGGVGHLLGQVGPGESRTFEYDRMVSGSYRLVAGPEGPVPQYWSRRSDSFPLRPGATVHWEVDRGRVMLTDPDTSP